MEGLGLYTPVPPHLGHFASSSLVVYIFLSSFSYKVKDSIVQVCSRAVSRVLIGSVLTKGVSSIAFGSIRAVPFLKNSSGLLIGQSIE